MQYTVTCARICLVPIKYQSHNDSPCFSLPVEVWGHPCQACTNTTRPAYCFQAHKEGWRGRKEGWSSKYWMHLGTEVRRTASIRCRNPCAPFWCPGLTAQFKGIVGSGFVAQSGGGVRPGLLGYFIYATLGWMCFVPHLVTLTLAGSGMVILGERRNPLPSQSSQYRDCCQGLLRPWAACCRLCGASYREVISDRFLRRGCYCGQHPMAPQSHTAQHHLLLGLY